MRLDTNIKPKEAIFQVILDAFALTPFYQAFLITSEDKSFKDLPLEHDILSFIKDLEHSGDIIYLTDVSVDYLHQLWSAFATIINKCLSDKETRMDKICLSRAQILWADSDTSPKQKHVQASRGTKLKTKAKVAKSNKKKQPTKMTNAKGLDVLSKVALTKAEQLKLATKITRHNFISHKQVFRDEILDPNLINVDQTKHEEEDVNERVHTPSDYKLTDDEKIHDDENIDDEKMMDEEEEDEVTKELYKDVNVNFRNEDTEMTDADQGCSGQHNVSQESGFEQEEEDAHRLFSDPIESLSPHVVTAAKLPINNPNEFDLWKMRIEQYFLMTDYSLWEVILNGDSPTLTRVVNGVVQAISPTTAEQKLAKKNELKAKGTLLMALPDKHQLKFNIHKDSKSLMEAIEKRFGSNKETKKVQKTLLKQQYEKFSGSSSKSLDQIHDRLQKLISQLEILVSVVPSVSAASTKVLVSALPNVDNLSDDVIYSFFTRANGTTSIGFDMSKVECYNCHRRGHFSRECRSPRDTKNKDTQRKNVPVGLLLPMLCLSSPLGSDSEKTCLETVEARLVVYQQNENVFEEDIKLLKLDVMLRDNVLVELRKKFEKAEQERDELKLTLEKFQTSSKNLSKLLASQITDKTGLGYDNQVFNSIVFDCDELNSSASDESVFISPVHDRYKLGKGYHAIPLPYTGTFMPPKPDLVFHDAPTASEIGNPQQALKDKSVIDSGCSRHMTGNISYLSDFEEINRGYVAFGGNPKGGNLVRGLPSKVFENNHTCVACKKGKQHRASWIKREFSVARTPQRNGVTERTNRVLVTKPHNKTPYELLLSRTHGNQPNSSAGIQGNFDAGKVGKESVFTQQYVLLPLWFTGSNDPQNTYADVSFDDKQNESEVHVSLSSSDKPKKHDEKANLSDEFKDFSSDSTNRVNAVSAPVTPVRPNLTNNTNSFNVAGPSDNVVSPTFEIGGKSSFVDPSQYPNDPDMHALE
nr:ribonuclease H-like domain-containing protein [Tanacetum cinerariifolium]